MVELRLNDLRKEHRNSQNDSLHFHRSSNFVSRRMQKSYSGGIGGPEAGARLSQMQIACVTRPVGACNRIMASGRAAGNPQACRYVRFHRDIATRLSSACVPDRPRRLVVPAFTPDCVGGAVRVDGQAKEIPEWESESAAKNVVIPACRPGELLLAAPARATIRRCAIKRIPQPAIRTSRLIGPHIHPCDAHIS